MDRDDLFVGGSTVSGDRDLCPTSRIHLYIYIYLYQGPIFVLYKRRKVNSTSPSSAPRADLVTVHYYASFFFPLARIERILPPPFSPETKRFAKSERSERTNRTRLHRLMERNDLLVEAVVTRVFDLLVSTTTDRFGLDLRDTVF